MLARYIPDRDADGPVLGRLALLMDVTAPKKTEFHLKEANEVARRAGSKRWPPQAGRAGGGYARAVLQALAITTR